MEHIKCQLDDDMFDKAVHGSIDHRVLPDLGDLAVYVKRNATEGGAAGAVLTFTVQLPDGSLARVQTVTTVALLDGVLSAIRGWREGGHL